MPSSAPLLSVSERARRLHRQLAWRRARGCDPSYVMELDGTTITTLQTPCGEVKGLGTGASVWDTAIVLARYPLSSLPSLSSRPWQPFVLLFVFRSFLAPFARAQFPIICTCPFAHERLLPVPVRRVQ
jgi:hypothetical protein